MKKIALFIAVLLTAVVFAVVIVNIEEIEALLPEGGTGAVETNVGAISPEIFPDDETTVSDTTEMQTAPSDTTFPETTVPETTAPITEPPATEPPVTEPPETEPLTVDNIPYAAPGHFDSSLFIGDSRTVGLSTYANLGTATVFASKGMNVFRVSKEQLDVPGIGSADLDEVLSAKKYEKIYIMLGINEIGYNANAVISKYTEIVNKVKSAQPDAIIYLQANLHITAERSDNDTVYNNTKLNALNDGMSALANGTNILYMDANIIFDDEKGALTADYASDDFHLMSRYYIVWANWIAHNS